MAVDDVMGRLPRIIPESDVEVDREHHEFSSDSDVYVLQKAPVTSIDNVWATVNGSFTDLVEGTDYAVVDSNGDGEDDAIDFSIGGSDPDDGSDFTVDYVAESVISRYVSAHEDDLDSTNDVVDEAIESSHVDTAMGTDLNQIGGFFRRVGKRRGRSDARYRILLRTIVQAFSGRGTKPGMKFAIATGVGTDPENITITEDFVEVGYTIQIQNVNSAFYAGIIDDMAELSDPSGVELLSVPSILLDGGNLEIVSRGISVENESSGLGSGTLSMDGTSTLGSPMTWDETDQDTSGEGEGLGRGDLQLDGSRLLGGGTNESATDDDWDNKYWN